MVSKFYKSFSINDTVTGIVDLSGCYCYLVTGETGALLIDSTWGVGNLKAFVRELTDLPVTVAGTHMHLDHIGGSFYYGKCHVHPEDIKNFYVNEASSREGMKNYFKDHMQSLGNTTVVRDDDYVEIKPITTIPVQEGSVFEIGRNPGENSIKVIDVPGHTRGSIVLLDRRNRILYAGDACNVNTMLCTISSTSVEEYRESLAHLKTFEADFDTIYGGHEATALPKHLVDEGIELCDEILLGKDDAEPEVFLGIHCLYGKKHKNFKRLDGKLTNIAYLKEKIFKPK
jgi:glyoxylase-like metal-dependent hydrolase (beta-lactamase superfamily II)